VSIPITQCLLSKAARGNEAAYTTLLERMKYNLKIGGWSLWRCGCNPACEEPTQAQMDALNDRLTADLLTPPPPAAPSEPRQPGQ